MIAIICASVIVELLVLLPVSLLLSNTFLSAAGTYTAHAKVLLSPKDRLHRQALLL